MLKVLVVGQTLIVNRNDRAVAIEEYRNPRELKATLKDMRDSGSISERRYNHLVNLLNKK